MLFARRKTPAGPTHDAPAPLYDHLNLDPKLLVSFTTDTEGNWEYFRRFVERAEGLEWKGMGPSGYAADIELKDGWRFIFGGDAVDKGNAVGGSIRVVNSLLALKRRYPDRVTLLLGNRDLNKMRLTSELAPSELAPELLPMLDGPRWVPAAKRVTPEQYLRKLCALRSNVEPDEVTAEQLAPMNTLANRMRYILKETMGAEGELERRSAELDELEALGVDLTNLVVPRASSGEIASLPSSGEIASVERAVASFVVSVGEGGWMRELITKGELGVLSDETLFVHGGLISGRADYGLPPSVDEESNQADAFGHVPGRRGERFEQAVPWLHALSEWKHAAVTEWIRSPTWTWTSQIRPDQHALGTCTASPAVQVDLDIGGGGGDMSKGHSPATLTRARGGEALLNYSCPGQGSLVGRLIASEYPLIASDCV